VSQFHQPGISDPDEKFVAKDHNGHLLLFFPTQFQSQVKTQHGDADAVATKIVDLDTGRILDNALIFATALVTQLKAAVAEKGMVLGRLGQGQNTKGNPPWLLSPHTAEDVAKAEAWLAANPRNQFGNPSTPVASEPQATAGPVAPVAAPAAGGADPALVLKLVQAGAPVQPGMTQAQLEQVAALLGI